MASSPQSTPATPAAIEAVRLRHPGRWIAAGLLLLVLAWLVTAALQKGVIEWSSVRRFLFNDTILEGVRNTIVLAVAAQMAGIVLGVAFAVMRLSRNPVLSVTSWSYIWFFRGTPVLVQLLFWYAAVPQVFSSITVAVPFTDIVLFSARTTDVMTSFVAAFLGLALNEGAYMAEIVRAGILSVDEGQTEAAHALGMVPSLTMRRIVLPQAMRVIIPPTGNEFISMLKTTSLASVVIYGELLRRSRDIYTTNLQTLELLMVASLWYLVLTSVATVGQYYVERRFARGSLRDLPPTPLQRLRRYAGWTPTPR